MDLPEIERQNPASYFSGLPRDLTEIYLKRFFRGYVDTTRWTQPFHEIKRITEKISPRVPDFPSDSYQKAYSWIFEEQLRVIRILVEVQPTKVSYHLLHQEKWMPLLINLPGSPRDYWCQANHHDPMTISIYDQSKATLHFFDIYGQPLAKHVSPQPIDVCYLHPMRNFSLITSANMQLSVWNYSTGQITPLPYSFTNYAKQTKQRLYRTFSRDRKKCSVFGNHGSYFIILNKSTFWFFDLFGRLVNRYVCSSELGQINPSTITFYPNGQISYQAYPSPLIITIGH